MLPFVDVTASGTIKTSAAKPSVMNGRSPMSRSTAATASWWSRKKYTKK